MLEALLAILAAIVPFVLKWIDSIDKKAIPDETEEINLFASGKVIEAFGVHDRRGLKLRETFNRGGNTHRSSTGEPAREQGSGLLRYDRADGVLLRAS